MIARWLSVATLLLVASFSPVRTQAARQAVLGDYTSVFAAEYGQPVASRQLKTIRALTYQRCAQSTGPQRTVLFAQNMAIAVIVSTCGGPVPADWRVRAKSYLPADSIFARAQPYRGSVQYIYRSAILAETAPGALCSARDAADGYAILQSEHGAYVAGAVTCLLAAMNVPAVTPPPVPSPNAAEIAASKAACAPFLSAGNQPQNGGQWGAPPKRRIDTARRYQVKLYTDRGVITADMLTKLAPITVNNFIFLACNGFYNHTIFHRTIPDFMIQGGDPTGMGTGGPGYTIPDERVARPYQLGDMAMANTGQPHSGGSQFFIIQGKDGLSLPLSYALFGHVAKGQTVVNSIAKAPAHASTGAENSAPDKPVFIRTITLLVSQ